MQFVFQSAKEHPDRIPDPQSFAVIPLSLFVIRIGTLDFTNGPWLVAVEQSIAMLEFYSDSPYHPEPVVFMERSEIFFNVFVKDRYGDSDLFFTEMVEIVHG